MNAQNPLNRGTSNRTRLLRGLTAPLAAAIMMALPTTSFAGFFLSVDIAPPPLPIYEQPAIPGEGYIWTPGYWAYSDDGYFWVPGTWVFAPYRGALWTPGYWGYSDDGYYAFHSGYWGEHIGFYVGINYGYGYGGSGYEGGYWNNGGFYYNRSINNFGSTNVTNVYNKTIINNTTINNTTINNTSFNGGAGGVAARPTQAELVATNEKHTQAIAAQQRQVQLASHNKALLASVNHGAPPIAATQKPGVFAGKGVVRAHDVSPESRAAVTKAEQAKPVGPPVKSVAALMNPRSAAPASRTAPHAGNQAPLNRATGPSASPTHGRPTGGTAGQYQSAHVAGSTHDARQTTQPRATAQPRQQQPRPMAQPHQQPRPMAEPRQQQPRPMAQPRQQQPRPMAEPRQQQPRPMAQPRPQQPRPMAQPRQQPQRAPASPRNPDDNKH